MICGTILYDNDFQFFNTGQIIDKLSVVVCESGECHFVLVATSQPIGKGTTPGCQAGDKPPNFFIPKNTGWFDRDTWILLDELTELNNLILDAKVQAKTLVEYQNKITRVQLIQILECGLKSPYMDGFDKEFIQRALDLLSI